MGLLFGGGGDKFPGECIGGFGCFKADLGGHVSPLIAAEGYFFCLDTKEAKNQVSKKASLPHKAPAANRSEPRAGNLLPSPTIHPSTKVPYALTTHGATIVLPNFGRSWFADGVEKKSCKS
ncbi:MULTISPECIES: hypothetical protein [unclassified Mucilaginibacter]|uniref:hypothetical protein n=1 Tax=unclassified Mucilaginibacter TaxID=2617802 RepID=UPI002AC97621|nr:MULTISPECIES: hypothetical protein [unclassified Mucilaginibacter]MEB0278137.1 hypothetical protein [Mucilaginibacter sp. 10B2]MEB0301371.1 hypothetical protein [Mucilaginibacter sp. 5C4]WPX23049.1 hypothetical protein RHM67_17355 [Mucilaginibacter sp. 5C4]